MLFALSVTTLVALVGLSIDGLRVYITYSQAQRAAEAAALAGAPYLPDFPTSATPAPDGNDATDRAVREAAKNGFGDASAISVTETAGPTPTIHVTIHISVALALLSVIGLAPVASAASASAEVLPPIALGGGAASMGDMAEGVEQQVATISSANELMQRGDPFTPLCASGWSEASDTTHADAATPIYTSYLGIATNLPQYGGGPQCSPGSPGNPDQIAPGFGGLATRATAVPTGNSYLVTIPAGGANYSVWVWNPRFVWQGNASQNSLLYTNENIYNDTGNTDNPAFYSDVSYSLFSAPELYNRAADAPIAALWAGSQPPDTSPDPPLTPGQIVNIPPLDAYGRDVQVHGCPAGGAWNLSGGSTYGGTIIPGQGCLASLPADVGAWVQEPATLAAPAGSPAFFRLTADVSDGSGRQSYAVKVCHNATGGAVGCAADGATIAGWNSDTMTERGAALTETYPLANIGAAYAGRQVQLSLFNPGYGAGNVTLTIVPPAAGGTVTYPAYLRMTGNVSTPAIQTSQNGDCLYHGKWVRLTLTLPPDYSGGLWQVTFSSDTGAPNTTMTVTANLVGPSIVLLPGA